MAKEPDKKPGSEFSGSPEVRVCEPLLPWSMGLWW